MTRTTRPMRSPHVPRARRVRPSAAAAVAGVLASAACSLSVEPRELVQPGMSEVARRYVDEYLGVMRARSLKRNQVDWVAFRATVVEKAPLAQTIEQTHPILHHALTVLADGHSSFRTANGRTFFVPTRTCRPSGAATPTALPADVGYVRVGSFGGTVGAAAVAFADSIQRVIRAADRDGLAGWIVDLRGNGGGNMWPMLAGLAPIVGDDVLGHFVEADGTTQSWEVRDGASRLGSAVQTAATAPYRLRRERPRVAVLTDNGVASSGEAVAVSFRQRPDTRAFGVATCGLSTANAPFFMSDGGVLNLTVAVMADRARRAYGDAVAPDETIADPDAMVQRAIAWLRAGR
jgi:hypothetical protein